MRTSDRLWHVRSGCVEWPPVACVSRVRNQRVIDDAVQPFWHHGARMVIGYARVAIDGQDESLQIDALEQAGCERIYVDRASGAIRERPELTNALRDLRDVEDVLVAWRLDRIGRNLRHLVDLVGGPPQPQDRIS